MRFRGERIRKANPISLGNILGRVTEELGLESTLFYESIKRNWESIVGSTNAKNIKPLTVKNGILTISVSSPAWMTQARFYKASFINKINKFEHNHTAEIHDILYKLERS